MVTSKKINIFRVTTAGQGPTVTDRIDFNDPTFGDYKDTTKEFPWITSITKTEPESIGNNMAAEKTDGIVQPGGTSEGIWLIEGKISNVHGNSDNGVNAFLTKLQSWKDDAQVIKAVWEGGRFGIIDANCATNNLTPIGTGTTTIGLIFINYKKKINYQRNEAEITLTFQRSRGLDV